LKDAAAAVYGARGAYGVIVVTTKRGKTGAPKISYSTSIGRSDAQLPK
jgi:TonB-dependent SusC/RagA subfamily outer membrane receptor